MGRKKNPRVELVKQLRLAKTLLESDISIWTKVSRQVPDFELNEAGQPRRPGESYLIRPRRHDEYPESSPGRWRQVASTLRTISDWAAATATDCEYKADQLEYQQRREAGMAPIGGAR